MDSHRSLPLVIRARVYIAMILSAVYMLSPLDFIAEGILGLVGLLGDLIILLIFFFHVAAIYRPSVVVMEVLELCYSCGKFTPIIKVGRKMLTKS